MSNFQFGEAERQIHDFFWGEFCDWYIEIAKIRLSQVRFFAFACAGLCSGYYAASSPSLYAVHHRGTVAELKTAFA